MDSKRLSEEWLFQRHPKEQIGKWVQNLEYSYFNRARGGHANDGDYFSLVLQYNHRNELLDILKRLDIVLKLMPKGQSKIEIKDFPEYEQPGHTKIHGIKCYCWIGKGEIGFSFSGEDGDPYEVSERDFEACKKLEQLLKSNGLSDKVSRRYENSVTCISRKIYRDLFR